jgi:hypothetical protein
VKIVRSGRWRLRQLPAADQARVFRHQDRVLAETEEAAIIAPAMTIGSAIVIGVILHVMSEFCGILACHGS